MRRYLINFPIGMGIALIPFFLELQEHRTKGQVAWMLFLSLVFGLVVTTMVMLAFAAVYAGLTLIYIKTRFQLWNSFLLQIAVGLLGAVLGIWTAAQVRARLTGRVVEKNALFGALVAGGVIAVFFLLYNGFQNARRDMLALKAAVAEARYQALEQQMRPHFLFNALNSLAELIEAGHENSARLTHALADLYRQILKHSGLKTAPLTAEIEIARRYLEIEKIRFGKRLRYSINLCEDAEKLYLPSLVVQTLVENAVKHGILKALDGGDITISCQRTEAQLYQLCVSNTGQPVAATTSQGTGLANTRERLALLYGTRHHFKLESDAAGQTVASFYFTGEKLD
ncbi:MAG: histidine kinase [Acidobacteria bacterium]|nr:histidine kinase [Acidobacteriota bacterium]